MVKKLILILLCSILFTACSSEKTVAIPLKTAPVSITNINIDNYFVKGANLQQFTSVPQRVVVVGENETETLLELGVAPNILTAVAQNTRQYAMKDANRELFQHLPKCQSVYLNMEYITKLKPDLIIAQQCIFVRNRLNNTDYWNQRGIKTLVPLNTNSPGSHRYQETVAKEMQFISDLGRTFGVENRANEIIAGTYSTITKINSANYNLYKPRVMIVEFLSSLISYDRTKLIGNMVESIGGRVSETPSVIGFENIIKADPDILFVVCSHANYGACIDKIWGNKALQNLTCVKNKRVYSIPLRFTYGASCRTEDGLKFLAARMYPEMQSDFE